MDDIMMDGYCGLMDGWLYNVWMDIVGGWMDGCCRWMNAGSIL